MIYISLARSMFDVFDSDTKGYIKAKEIKRTLMFIMEGSSAEERNQVVQHFR